MTTLEHVNTTVRDAHATAAWMQKVFGWRIRWEGASMNGLGYTIHVGDDQSYVALYQPKTITEAAENDYLTAASLNHIAVVTDDLNAVETKVKQVGFEPHSHGDYEPGKRFYFHDADRIEYEVVFYD